MHTSCYSDDTPLGSPLAALRDRQVAARLRRPSDRRVGAENLVGRTLPERVSGRIVDIGARTTVGRRPGSLAGAICHIIALGAEWLRPHSSGLNPDAFTIGPHRSMSALISRANSAGELPAGSKDSLSRPALTSRVFSASRTAGPSLPRSRRAFLPERRCPTTRQSRGQDIPPPSPSGPPAGGCFRAQPSCQPLANLPFSHMKTPY